MPNTPWKEAVERVLAEKGEAMHYADIASRIEELDLRDSLGATPANSVSTTLSLSLKNDGDTPFYKAGTGLYGLKNHPQEETFAVEPTPDTAEVDTIVVKALGMFWIRANVQWKSSPSILGRQQVGSDSVNFFGQRGIYLLHDRHDVIYVGRSTDRPLGQRLYEHTIDRLSGRWDRFSWFGLYGVSDDGDLLNEIPEFDGDAIIQALESVLIESLEPPLNRRRGDNLTAVEFMQALDPEIEKRQIKNLLQQALTNIDT